MHIAISRGYGVDFVRKLLQEECASELLEHRAKGKFFKEPKLSGGYYTMLGETPLGFAACSGDPDVFDLLWQEFQKGGTAVFKTEEEGHGLLHLVVIASASKDLKTGKPAVDISAVNMLKRVLPVIQAAAEKETEVYELLTREINNDGYTPLSLAAAKDSVEMFCEIFDRKILTTLWVYNSVHCKKMYLAGVDVDLDELAAPAAASQCGGADRGTGIETDGGSRSLLETLVEYRRQDILHHSQINELVETKWDMYGREIFYRELLVTFIFTVTVYLLPMTKFSSSWAWRISHVCSHAVVALTSRSLCYSRDHPTALQLFVFNDPRAGKFFVAEAKDMLYTYPRRMLGVASAETGAITPGSIGAALCTAVARSFTLSKSGAAAAPQLWLAAHAWAKRTKETVLEWLSSDTDAEDLMSEGDPAYPPQHYPN